MIWIGTVFVEVLHDRGFSGPFEIENEAKNSKDTQNMAAINQGAQACINFLSPLLWKLGENGYKYTDQKELKTVNREDIPVMTMDQLR
ncbi:hypothetical protein [Sphingobacterium daejeonense]|uniref:hypothetical protein n=1 Tax=Sphingobacterium daejeonense TaxID=371142 RepID=UPI0010C39812|nr:hypothetical protein [Sphingobacterium daejeonense]VTQ03796.1 Uncharacterised protein [Sphingobacterium daejeonense]